MVWCLVGESNTGLLVTSELLYHLTNKAICCEVHQKNAINWCVSLFYKEFAFEKALILYM